MVTSGWLVQRSMSSGVRWPEIERQIDRDRKAEIPRETDRQTKIHGQTLERDRQTEIKEGYRQRQADRQRQTEGQTDIYGFPKDQCPVEVRVRLPKKQKQTDTYRGRETETEIQRKRNRERLRRYCMERHRAMLNRSLL